jgi:hypothetical protein
MLKEIKDKQALQGNRVQNDSALGSYFYADATVFTSRQRLFFRYPDLNLTGM